MTKVPRQGPFSALVGAASAAQTDWKRKAVHAGMGLFALALRFVDWRVAAAGAAAALLFNTVVMPRVGRGLYRDAGRRHDAGIVAYPAMVLLLILVFRGPLPADRGGRLGDDGVRRSGRRRRRKGRGRSAAPVESARRPGSGLLANWAVAGAASNLVFLFVSRRAPEPDTVAILMIGAGIYAFLESVQCGHGRQLRRRRCRRPWRSTTSGCTGRRPALSNLSGRWLALALAVNLGAALLMEACASSAGRAPWPAPSRAS